MGTRQHHMYWEIFHTDRFRLFSNVNAQYNHPQIFENMTNVEAIAQSNEIRISKV